MTNYCCLQIFKSGSSNNSQNLASLQVNTWEALMFKPAYPYNNIHTVTWSSQMSD